MGRSNTRRRTCRTVSPISSATPWTSSKGSMLTAVLSDPFGRGDDWSRRPLDNPWLVDHRDPAVKDELTELLHQHPVQVLAYFGRQGPPRILRVDDDSVEVDFGCHPKIQRSGRPSDLLA